MESSEESSKCGVTSVLDDNVEDTMLCVEEVTLAVTNVWLKDASEAKPPELCNNSSLMGRTTGCYCEHK